MDAKEDEVDYGQLIKQYPWIATKKLDCILSPDSDGFLCGLLMSHVLGWNIRGFYDGKILVYDRFADYHHCIFLDLEINRSDIRSIGNHMIEYNRSLVLENFNFGNCLQPNILRGFDGKNVFDRKYPFGTIHLILGILQSAGSIQKISKNAVSPLLFADGVGNNLFGYPENCLDWIRYLGINRRGHILHPLFCDSGLNFYDVMEHLRDFFVMRDKYNATGYYGDNEYMEGGRNKRTGHQLKISNTKGEMINVLEIDPPLLSIHEKEKKRVECFISELGNLTGWEYDASRWSWTNLKMIKFQKGMLSGESADLRVRLNNRNYLELFRKNPFSLAMTASNRIEYSLE